MRLRYDQETRERVIRMFFERREAEPQEAVRMTLRHVGELVGVPPDTVRGWVDRARVDAREKPGVTTSEREEIKALRRENAELRRANEILKTASAFFAAAELDRKLK